MADAVASIMDGIVAILDGTATDVDRAITAGRFRHVEASAERTGAMAASGKARPFTLEPMSMDIGPDMPANVSGTHVHGSHALQLIVLYATRRQETYSLLKEIMGDLYDIRRSLGWPLAWAQVSGWTGLEITDTGLELMGPGEPPDLLGLVVSIRVDHREDWG